MVWNRIELQPCEAFQMKQNPSMTISYSISKNTWLELSKDIKQEQNHTKEVLESLESDILPDTNCHHFEYSCPRLNTASCWPWVWPPAPSSAQVHWKPRHNPGLITRMYPKNLGMSRSESCWFWSLPPHIATKKAELRTCWVSWFQAWTDIRALHNAQTIINLWPESTHTNECTTSRLTCQSKSRIVQHRHPNILIVRHGTQNAKQKNPAHIPVQLKFHSSCRCEERLTMEPVIPGNSMSHWLNTMTDTLLGNLGLWQCNIPL